MNVVLVFFGGGVGCVIRYLIGIGFQKTGTTLPWSTFLANTSACLIFAGVMWITSSKESWSPALRLLLLTGFCGGLSTFSTFGYETFLLLKHSLYMYAFLNIVISCALSMLIFYLFN